MTVQSWPFLVERYCTTSGRAVKHAGDRCLAHGAASAMCPTDLRPPQCEHLRLSLNHPQPHCSECGKDLGRDA